MTAQSAADPRHARIDRLLDAVDLLREDRRPEAIRILRELIREDGDFEDAWLWMSVAVDSVDQSAVCLDNVLRSILRMRQQRAHSPGCVGQNCNWNNNASAYVSGEIWLMGQCGCWW